MPRLSVVLGTVAAVTLAFCVVSAHAQTDASAISSGQVASPSIASSDIYTDSPAPTTSAPAACRVKYCSVCEPDDPTQCHTCEDAYKLKSNRLCTLKCRVLHCVLCDAADSAKCAVCSSGYFLNYNYLCVGMMKQGAARAPRSLLVTIGTVLLSAAAAAL